MSERGAMITVVATGLANAVAADEADTAGFDLAAGMFGVAVSAWIRSLVDDILAAKAAPPKCPYCGNQRGALLADHISQHLSTHAGPPVLGMNVIVDQSLPPGTFEIRVPHNTVRIDGLNVVPQRGAAE